MARRAGAFEVTTEDGRVVFSRLLVRGMRAVRSRCAARIAVHRALILTCALPQVSRLPTGEEVVATIRTMVPDVGTIDGAGFGGCA